MNTRLTALLCALALSLGLTAQTAPRAAARAAAPQTSAKGAVVMDFQTGEFYYEKEADTPRPIASMSKIMSLYLVFQAMDQGRLTPQTLIPVSDYAWRVSHDPEYSGGEAFERDDQVEAGVMIALILTVSCNASVIALAEYLDGAEEAFTARMNATAQAWGVDAHYADCTGFESDGNAVSPRAQAEITRRLLTDYPQVLDYATLRTVDFRGRTFFNNNKLMMNRVVEGMDGLKTGWTLASGHCFTGTACREGRRIISVVLDAGSREARMGETAKLLEYGFACRAEWEAQWGQVEDALQVSFAPVGSPQAFRENAFTATLTGVEVPVPCTLAVEIQGRRYPLESQALTDGLTIPFTCGVNWGKAAQLTLAVTFPDGVTLRRSGQVALAPLDFAGFMSLSRSGFRRSLSRLRSDRLIPYLPQDPLPLSQAGRLSCLLRS